VRDGAGTHYDAVSTCNIEVKLPDLNPGAWDAWYQDGTGGRQCPKGALPAIAKVPRNFCRSVLSAVNILRTEAA